MADNKDFRQRTEDGLVACGKWLENNARQLSETIEGGCRGWSVEFAWNCIEDCPAPEIHINVDKIDRDVIEAYW